MARLVSAGESAGLVRAGGACLLVRFALWRCRLVGFSRVDESQGSYRGLLLHAAQLRGSEGFSYHHALPCQVCIAFHHGGCGLDSQATHTRR